MRANEATQDFQRLKVGPSSEGICRRQRQEPPPVQSALFPMPAEETAEPTHSGDSSCGQTLPLFKCLTSILFQNPTHKILDKNGFLRTRTGQGLVENEFRVG